MNIEKCYSYDKSLIIDFLGKNQDKEFTITELSAVLKISSSQILKLIRKINVERYNLILFRQVGKCYLVKINENHPILETNLVLSEFYSRKEMKK